MSEMSTRVGRDEERHQALMAYFLKTERSFRALQNEVRDIPIEEVILRLRTASCSIAGDDDRLRDRLLRCLMQQENPKAYTIPWYADDDARLMQLQGGGAGGSRSSGRRTPPVVNVPAIERLGEGSNAFEYFIERGPSRDVSPESCRGTDVDSESEYAESDFEEYGVARGGEYNAATGDYARANGGAKTGRGRAAVAPLRRAASYDDAWANVRPRQTSARSTRSAQEEILVARSREERDYRARRSGCESDPSSRRRRAPPEEYALRYRDGTEEANRHTWHSNEARTQARRTIGSAGAPRRE